MGQPRTCLHALLNMLQQGVDSGPGPQCLHDTPRLAELAYQLVYKLCAVRDTSAPTLRYLRTTYDFLFQQLRHLPFDQTDYSEWILLGCAGSHTSVQAHTHEAWFLKLCLSCSHVHRVLTRMFCVCMYVCVI